MFLGGKGKNKDKSIEIMTIIKNTDNIHPDIEVDCEYAVSANCLEGSIANDRRFDRVFDYTKKATVFICHPCTRILAERGELIGIRSNAVQVPTIIRYEFLKSKNSTSQRKF